MSPLSPHFTVLLDRPVTECKMHDIFTFFACKMENANKIFP